MRGSGGEVPFQRGGTRQTNGESPSVCAKGFPDINAMKEEYEGELRFCPPPLHYPVPIPIHVLHVQKVQKVTKRHEMKRWRRKSRQSICSKQSCKAMRVQVAKVARLEKGKNGVGEQQEKGEKTGKGVQEQVWCE